MRAAVTTLLLAALLGLGACGGDEEGGGAEPPASVDEPCDEVTAPEPRTAALDPPPKEPSAQKLTAVVDTSCGTFEIALDAKGNPRTVASFEYLAENGVYDDTLWHRIALNPPIIQGGDPLGQGTGGPGYSVDEEPAPDTAYTKGVVAMAKTEAEPPGRSGSQFFIVTGADAGLPPIYAVLGEVTEGFDVVRTIAAFGDPSGQTEDPLEPVLINSVTIEEG